MKIIFATNNQNKVNEIRLALPSSIQVVSLREAGINIDIPEPHDTLRENAAEKARTIYQLTGESCFSEDTGLEVAAINNEPGVHSARYAGESRSFQQNIDKLLSKLTGLENRSARFRTVFCLVLEGKEYYFEGICEGRIIEKQKGDKGFGYDPVFVPDGSELSFAEMDMKEKNLYSHRRKAADLLVAFLNQITLK
ncbi:MAG: RdgB/HAM1 family non-canonical purine NTP pyrophosphatase [Flavisolibacter sp.]